MADKRRDSGEYYPGGRVIARPGTAPKQVVVQWSDVQGKPQIAPLPERYRDSDVKGKINEIASKFASLVVAAMIGWSAFGELVVQKAQKDQIWNDEEIVTNAYLTGENASGAARTLPKYLWLADFADSYPDAAQEYYRSRGNGKVDGGCSAVRRGGYLSRNFDFPFDERSEFVVRMAAGAGRFASVGVAQVGTNLTEAIVTSGKPSRWYKALPGATVDGINERGVIAEINVVDTPVMGWHTGGDIHPLAAVRWVLDNATNAYQAATYLAANIRFPQGWAQNYHYMVADAEKTYIVENGTATDGDEYHEPDEPVTMTNFQLSKFPWDGMGMERFGLLLGGANITNAWYTRAYRRETTPPWVSDLAEVIAYTNDIFDAWATHDKEYFRSSTKVWWQTVHTSIYDMTNRTLRIAVQETDDWYTFAVPVTGGVKVETDPTVPEWAKEPNPPPSMTAEEAAEIANNAISTNAATTNLAAKLAAKYSKPSDGIPESDLAASVNESLGKADSALQPNGFAKLNQVKVQNITIGPNSDLVIGDYSTIWLSSGYQITFSDHGENLDNRIARLAPAPGNYAAVSNAAMKAMLQIEDAPQNLRYKITASDGRFYFTPTGAINPED